MPGVLPGLAVPTSRAGALVPEAEAAGLDAFATSTATAPAASSAHAGTVAANAMAVAAKLAALVPVPTDDADAVAVDGPGRAARLVVAVVLAVAARPTAVVQATLQGAPYGVHAQAGLEREAALPTTVDEDASVLVDSFGKNL